MFKYLVPQIIILIIILLVITYLPELILFPVNLLSGG